MNPTKAGWLTSEFWLAVAGVAAKVVIVLVILGVIPADKQEGTTQAVINLIISIGGILGISLGTTSYAKGRTEIKKEMLRSQANRMYYQPPHQPGVRR